EENLMPGAGSPEGIPGERGVSAVEVGPPGDAAIPRQTSVGGGQPDRLSAQELLAVPVALVEQEFANTRHCPRREIAAAPRRYQGQAVHREGLAVADRPFILGHAKGP